jgi:hypothetical protein
MYEVSNMTWLRDSNTHCGGRSQNCHNLKILSGFFNDVRSGIKTSEIRKADRDFSAGDEIIFSPVCKNGNAVPSKTRLVCLITHIVRGGEFGIHEDYDMLSIRLIREERKQN